MSKCINTINAFFKDENTKNGKTKRQTVRERGEDDKKTRKERERDNEIEQERKKCKMEGRENRGERTQRQMDKQED